MSLPEIQRGGGIFLLVWKDEQISVTVDRIRENSHHEVHGEVLVQAHLPSMLPHLHQTRLNMVSTQSKEKLSKILDSRLNTIDWYAIVEQTCVKVLELWRQGEPLISIAGMEKTERMTHRLYPFLVEREANLLYGDGGVGKSYIAAYFACLIALPSYDLGFAPEPGNVLYLDYETTAAELRDRLEGICQAMGSQIPENFLYRRSYQPLADDIANVQKLILENDIQFLVVDSVGPACGGEPENSGVVMEYFNALRTLGITTLSVDHIAKAGHPNHKTPFGSVYKFNLARSVWELRRVPEPGGAMKIGLYHRKSNNARREKPQGFSIEFSEEGVRFHKETVKTLPQLKAGLGLVDKIYEALQSGAMSVTEIHYTIGEPESSIRVELNRHKGNYFTILSKTDGSKEWGLLINS